MDVALTKILDILTKFEMAALSLKLKAIACVAKLEPVLDIAEFFKIEF